MSGESSNEFLPKQLRGNYFGLTGPLGKGLGLTPQSKGTHIAFSAGTGILPYVDMVAKLLL
jgi:NAD(P)H-flavin reductase|tara:strand:+ start:241 stop:423 length:183 start_codon:yes stop_codon:yes gene_type:complete